MIKVKENNGVVDPMAKFKNNQNTLTYAEQLLQINDRKNKAMELKAVAAEEVKMEKKKEQNIMNMDNEDWDEDEVAENVDNNEDSDDSFDSNEGKD